MRNELGGWARGLRALALASIGALGLVTIVGSGGGFGWDDDSVCDVYPESCRPPPPPAPSVTVAPASATAQIGTAVSFVAQTANTSGALGYQWRRSSDGGATYVDIAGATDKTYAVGNVNLGDDGAVFLVVVLQASGGVLQATARLAVSVTPGVVFADGDFPVDHWQASPAIAAGYPEFSHVEERVESGGNAGAFRKMTVQVAPGSGLSRVLHLSVSSTYDPQVQGAISVVDYAEDCAVFSASDVNYVESSIVIEQGGRRYISDLPRILCTSREWAASARPGLRQQDFMQVDGPPCNVGEACPDFTATGAPIRFGYERISLTTPGGSVVQGIDNWKVTVWRK